MSAGARLGSRLRELRIHLCQKSDTSRGVREFIENHYVKVKQANPTLPILIRECSEVEPRLWARYAKGEEKSVSLSNLKANDVMQTLEQLK